MRENDDLIGFFELIFYPETRKCEVAYFGILDQFIGKKYGGYLLTEALKFGFRKNTKKVWLHLLFRPQTRLKKLFRKRDENF